MSDKHDVKEYIVIKDCDYVVTVADRDDDTLPVKVYLLDESAIKQTELPTREIVWTDDILFDSDDFSEAEAFLIKQPNTKLTQRFIYKYMIPSVMQQVYEESGLMGKDLVYIKEHVQNDLFDFIKHLIYFIDMELSFTKLLAEDSEKYLVKYDRYILKYFGDDHDEHLYTADGYSFQRIEDKRITYAYNDTGTLVSIHYGNTDYMYNYLYNDDVLAMATKTKFLLHNCMVFLKE